MYINQIGFDHFFEELEIENLDSIGRVSASHGRLFTILFEKGELRASLDNKLYQKGMIPTVGDFVQVEYVDEGTTIIKEILPRKSMFSRKKAGDVVEEQVLAANFDYVFIVSSLNQDFNCRKIERYLTAAYDSGATPVIILSKTDLCSDVEQKYQQVIEIAPFIDVIAISTHQEKGLERIKEYFKPGKTIVLLGSSGVGKSSLVNKLAGEDVLKVNDVREGDDRGRHTTTHRELFILPNSSMIIDTPGIRELALWNPERLDDVFNEIAELALHCKFNDCTHTSEPGCAVLEAIDNQVIDRKRYESYLKLKKEERYIKSKTEHKVRMENKKRAKKIATFTRDKKKSKMTY